MKDLCPNSSAVSHSAGQLIIEEVRVIYISFYVSIYLKYIRLQCVSIIK